MERFLNNNIPRKIWHCVKPSCMFIVPAPFYIRWKIETKYIEGNQTFAYILHKTVHWVNGYLNMYPVWIIYLSRFQCEPTLLPEPNHVMLNHLYALSIKVRFTHSTHWYSLHRTIRENAAFNDCLIRCQISILMCNLWWF